MIGNRVLLFSALFATAAIAVAIVVILRFPFPQSNSPNPINQSDGASLYAQYCASCHRSLATSNVRGRTATLIQTAISIFPKMRELSNLTPTQIQAIAEALSSNAITTHTPAP